MSAKHTPGPWHYWSYVDCDGDPRADGFAFVVECFSTREPTDQHNGYELGSGEEARANARLIAASPALLEALRRLLGATDAGNADTHHVGCRCVIHEARAAIRAAEGK